MEGFIPNDPNANTKLYHRHLDGCKECRENPMLSMCGAGNLLLRFAVDTLPKQSIASFMEGLKR